MRGNATPEANGHPLAAVSLSDFSYSHGKSKENVAWSIYKGDARQILPKMPAGHFNCVVTSPPYYWQRDYDEPEQIGLEQIIEGYVITMADVMDQVRRVLAKDGLLFLNLGDTYYSRKGEPKGKDRKNWARRFGLRAVDVKGLGVPRKTTIGIPWRVALEMINRGWTLRSPIVWKRKVSQPEPTAKDRPWRTYEMIFMFSKKPTYCLLSGRARRTGGRRDDPHAVEEHEQDADGILPRGIGQAVPEHGVHPRWPHSGSIRWNRNGPPCGARRRPRGGRDRSERAILRGRGRELAEDVNVPLH